MSNCEQDDGAAGMTTRPAGPGQRTPEQEENLARLAGIKDEDIEAQKKAHPGVELMVHPECGCLSSALKHADFIASTSGMVRHAKESPNKSFLVATETGILHTMKKENPGKTFIPVARAAQCEFMKKITVEKVLWSLQSLKHRITVPPDIADKARLAIDRMVRL